MLFPAAVTQHSHCYGARLRRANLHLSDSADSASYGVHGDVAPTPFNNFNTYAGRG